MPRPRYRTADDPYIGRALDVARAGAEDLDQYNMLAARENRVARNQDLDYEMQRWNFEKEKTLDDHAKLMKIETDKQAIEANEELFKIRTDSPDADVKLAEWGAKYYRVLDQKTGSPRLIQHFQINQQRVDRKKLFEDALKEKRALAQTESEEIKAQRAAAIDAGLVSTGVTIGGERFEAPQPANPKDAGTITTKIKQGEDDITITKPLTTDTEAAATRSPILSQHNTLEAEVNSLSGKPIPPAKIAQLNSLKAQLGFAPVAAATAAVPAATPPPRALIASKSDFDNLESGAEFVWNGKPGRKP